MRRSIARAVTGAAALAVTALGAPPPRRPPTRVVIGGSQVQISDSPWVVALSSRDRFGRYARGPVLRGSGGRAHHGPDGRPLPAATTCWAWP